MAKFYVIALRNDKLKDIAKEKPALPSFYENADSKELLGDVYTHIDEAVAIEWNDKYIFSILARERNDAIRDLCEKIKDEEERHCRSICEIRYDYMASFGRVPPQAPTPPQNNSLFESLANIYIKKFDRLKGTYVIPLLSNYVVTPWGWRDADTALDRDPQAAIVYITQDEFLTLPGYVQAHIARAIMAAKHRLENTILKRLAESVELLRDMTNPEPAVDNAEESPARDAAPDAAATVETGTAGLDFPPGFEVVENGNLKNDQGDKQPIPLEQYNLERFLDYVLPHIERITPRKAPAEYWARPKNGLEGIEPVRSENALISWNGKKYQVIYAECTIHGKTKYRYGVRLVTDENKGTGSTYFFFMGLD